MRTRTVSHFSWLGLHLGNEEEVPWSQIRAADATSSKLVFLRWDFIILPQRYSFQDVVQVQKSTTKVF